MDMCNVCRFYRHISGIIYTTFLASIKHDKTFRLDVDTEMSKINTYFRMKSLAQREFDIETRARKIHVEHAVKYFKSREYNIVHIAMFLQTDKSTLG